MKKFSVSFLIFVLCISCRQGDKNSVSTSSRAKDTLSVVEKNIYRCGDSMLSAFKRKDYAGFIKYQQPNMVERMGGPEAFESFVNLQMKQVPENVLQDIKLGKILQLVKTNTDQQCVVEQLLRVELDSLQIDRTNYLVGESLDGGINWTFFDPSAKSGLLPKDIKPDISEDLRIPASK